MNCAIPSAPDGILATPKPLRRRVDLDAVVLELPSVVGMRLPRPRQNDGLPLRREEAPREEVGLPVNSVFQFDGATLVNTYPVTPEGPGGATLVIPGVTSFSDWFAGSFAATRVVDWKTME